MASKKCIKMAVVGFGLVGPRHAEAIMKNRGAELVCIVDPSPAAATLAEQFHCLIFQSVSAMLDSPSQPDAALVCTPNHTHVAVAKELLEGGVDVLCEKPISVDVESGQELVECAYKHGRKLLIGHHRRFNRYVVTAKKHVQSLGQLIAVNGLWTIYKPMQYFDPPTEWRRLNSAGPVFINLIHDIDILHYLFGPITRVYAERTLSQRKFDTEEGAAITLRFASGMVGSFILSDAVVSPHNFECGTGENPTIPKVGKDFYRVFGSEGSLSIPDMIKWSYFGEEKSWNRELLAEKLEVPELDIPFELQIEHFVKVINEVEMPSCSGEEGLRAVAVCHAIKKSMEEGRPIEIVAKLAPVEEIIR